MRSRFLPLLCLLLVIGAAPQSLSAREPAPARRAIVAVDLPDDVLIQLSSWVAAAGAGDVFLLDSAFAAKPNQVILAGASITDVLAVGSDAARRPELETRLGRKVTDFLEWKKSPPPALRQKLFPRSDRLVVCPAGPRRLLLHGAWLAGVLRVPLLLAGNGDDNPDELRRWLAEGPVRQIIAIGSARPVCRLLLASTEQVPNPNRDPVQLEEMIGELAVIKAGRSALRKNGPIQTAVVANPTDAASGLGRMSLLASHVAARKKSALLLTDDKGDTALVKDVLTTDLRSVDTLLLLAGLKAIPTEKRVNPIEGKDVEIEMEPLTPRGTDVFSYATGRLFHDDAGMVLALLARTQLLPPDGKPRRALVVSNPGGGLPLLETFSRHTSNELRNAGYQTTSMFGDQANKEKMQKLVPEQDIFLWEGHYRTLIDEFGFLTWTEALPPAFYFLQSCLALKEEEASPLLQRGAFAIVGSSTRTYSATGGAFSVAFFDAMLYNEQSLGGALRQAKNYLLCYSLLKEKRLGDKAKLKGANVRSAWAFTLWGDPTLQLPRPPVADKALPGVTHEVRGSTIVVTLPQKTYEPVKVGKFEAVMVPNGRLAGLLTAGEEEDQKHLVPFVFVEVHLPRAPAGKKPLLMSKVAERSYVFNWDERRKVGYLLVTPRARESKELRFKVEWVE